MISCLFGRSRLSPGLSHLHCTSTLRGRQSTPILHRSQPQSSPWGRTPKAWASAPSPDSLWWVSKQLLCWEMPIGIDLCAKFSVLCLLCTCCCTPLWGSKAPLVPICEGVSKCVKTFPPSQLPPHGTRPIPFSLYLYFHSFFLPLYVKFSLPFWKSEVFC